MLSFFSSSSYIINCVSNTATTLTKTIVDDKAQEGPTTFNVTLTETDGVVPGTIYECSVEMEMDGYRSAKSFPTVLITRDASSILLYS